MAVFKDLKANMIFLKEEIDVPYYFSNEDFISVHPYLAYIYQMLLIIEASANPESEWIREIPGGKPAHFYFYDRETISEILGRGYETILSQAGIFNQNTSIDIYQIYKKIPLYPTKLLYFLLSNFGIEKKYHTYTLTSRYKRSSQWATLPDEYEWIADALSLNKSSYSRENITERTHEDYFISFGEGTGIFKKNELRIYSTRKMLIQPQILGSMFEIEILKQLNNMRSQEILDYHTMLSFQYPSLTEEDFLDYRNSVLYKTKGSYPEPDFLESLFSRAIRYSEDEKNRFDNQVIPSVIKKHLEQKETNSTRQNSGKSKIAYHPRVLDWRFYNSYQLVNRRNYCGFLNFLLFMKDISPSGKFIYSGESGYLNSNLMFSNNLYFFNPETIDAKPNFNSKLPFLPASDAQEEKIPKQEVLF